MRPMQTPSAVVRGIPILSMLLLLTWHPAAAQQTGSIAGVVRDESQAVLPLRGKMWIEQFRRLGDLLSVAV